MDLLSGSITDLVKTEHLVNFKITITGVSGTHRLDYRLSPTLLSSVGLRATVSFRGPPLVEIVTPTSADVSYNVRAVNYGRGSDSRPADIGDLARMPGSVEIVRSQLLNINRVPVGYAPNVTSVIKPDPLVGHSPVLWLAWSSLGTTATSSVVVILHCVVDAAGVDLPDF